jgi:hypothetical protein
MATMKNPATAAVVPPPQQLDRVRAAFFRELAERFEKSGAFDGATAGQLELRIHAGAALGLDPAVSCTNIAVSRGKIILSAALQANLLARSERYDYEPQEISAEKAVIKFLRNGSVFGVSSFTIEEAKRAGLTSKAIWQAYPSDLLYARALTRGIRRFAPDLLAGNVAYVREEVGENHHEPIPAKRETTKKPAEEMAPPPAAEIPKRGTITDQQLNDLKCYREYLELPLPDWREKILAKRNVKSAVEMSAEQAAELISALKTRVNAMQMEEELARRDRELAAQRNGELTVDIDAVGIGKEATAGPAMKRD